jgi:hypothetical protein
MAFLDPNDPFFAQAWRRWATALAPMIWAGVEMFAFASPGWALVFGAVGAYAFWVLIAKGPDQP